MSKLLVVDDEEHIRGTIREYDESEEHEIEEAVGGVDAIERCKQAEYDLVIVDIMMPSLDGFSAVKEICKDVQTPVTMPSARGEEYDRIHGFEIGIDDCVIKPFSPKELMMYVSAILKRHHGGVSTRKKDVYTYEGSRIDLTVRKVFVDDRKMEMSPKEYVLLFHLVHNEGIVLTRGQLIHDVWRYDLYGGNRALDMHIKLLRKNLQDYNRLIVTLCGVGCRFKAEK